MSNSRYPELFHIENFLRPSPVLFSSYINDGSGWFTSKGVSAISMILIVAVGTNGKAFGLPCLRIFNGKMIKIFWHLIEVIDIVLKVESDLFQSNRTKLLLSLQE